MVSQVMHSPYVERLDEVYKILRYLKGTPRMGLYFKKNEIKTLKCIHLQTKQALLLIGGQLQGIAHLCGATYDLFSKRRRD